MVNNADWLLKLNYIEFLRDVGRHFSVNRMLTLDSVRLRLEREQSLCFLEFNYMILQAYDFVELERRYGCNLQMGGSDQWGNIVNGVDLGRRMGTHQLYALTTPLLTTASGAKMGKTAQGAVWLNADMLSPYDFWQYWRNTEDADVGALPEALHDAADGRDRAARSAWRIARSTRPRRCWRPKRRRCCTAAQAAEEAAETARKTFEEGAPPKRLPTVEVGASRARSRHRPAVAVRDGRACRVERRGAPARPGRRACASTTSRSATNGASIGLARSRPGRRDQAVARPEEARAGAAGIVRPPRRAFAP